MLPDLPPFASNATASEAEDFGRSERARAACALWRKSLDVLLEDADATSRLEELLKPAHDAIRNFMDRFGALHLQVDAEEWIPGRGFSQRLHAEGLRKLVFRSGLSLLELCALSKILIAPRLPASEGLEGQVWQAQFRYVDSVWADAFDWEGLEALKQTLTNTPPRQRFGLARGAQVEVATTESKFAAQSELAGAHCPLELFANFANLLCRRLEAAPEKAHEQLSAFTQVLDGLLAHDELGTVNQLVLKLRVLERTCTPGEKIASLRRHVMQRMLEPERLERLGTLLRSTQSRPNADIARYLQATTTETLPAVLTLLEQLTLLESRMLVCDALTPFVKDAPELFVQRLSSERPHTVSDMIYMIERSNHPQKVELFAQVMRHRNLVVKIEALQLLARGQSPEARQLFTTALWDESAPVRMQAARLLSLFGREQAFSDLLAIIQESSFERRTRDEQITLYFALGTTAHPRAVQLFEELLQQPSTLLNRRRVVEDKLLAVSGLNGVASVDSVKVLQRTLDDADQPEEVRSATALALQASRRKVFGDGSRAQRTE